MGEMSSRAVTLQQNGWVYFVLLWKEELCASARVLVAVIENLNRSGSWIFKMDKELYLSYEFT